MNFCGLGGEKGYANFNGYLHQLAKGSEFMMSVSIARAARPLFQKAPWNPANSPILYHVTEIQTVDSTFRTYIFQNRHQVSPLNPLQPQPQRQVNQPQVFPLNPLQPQQVPTRSPPANQSTNLQQQVDMLFNKAQLGQFILQHDLCIPLGTGKYRTLGHIKEDIKRALKQIEK